MTDGLSASSSSSDSDDTTAVSITVDGLACTASAGADDSYYHIAVSQRKYFQAALTILVPVGLVELILHAFIGASARTNAIVVGVVMLIMILWIRGRISKEEVLLVEDVKARCVRVQCRSFDLGGNEHDLRRAHIIIDEALENQVVINECFIGISSIHDVLGFIAMLDPEPEFKENKIGHVPPKAKKRINEEDLHEDDSFVLAFEHFTPRLQPVELLYRGVHAWLSRVAKRHVKNSHH